MACLIALAAALFVFILIAADVTHDGALKSLDDPINGWLYAHRTDSLTTFLFWVSRLHSNLIVGTMTVAISAYLWVRHLRHWAFTFVLTVFGGMLLNALLKLLFARARPHFDNPILILRTYSFPSGHTMLATVFYVTLCVFVVTRLRNSKSRALAISFVILMVALVALSRMYLGAHYFTDVLAALMEGIAWVAASLLWVDVIRLCRKA
jgi:membrane-associated phospholipid phosphatase